VFQKSFFGNCTVNPNVHALQERFVQLQRPVKAYGSYTMVDLFLLEKIRGAGTMKMNSRRFSTALVAVGLFLAMSLVEITQAPAQTILVFPDLPHPLPRIPIRPIRPAPPTTPTVSYCIKDLDVQARIRKQIADVQVTQTFVNKSTTTVQAQFLFPLPYDGAIDRLTLMVDGEEFPASLLDKEEARRRYEAIVRANQDPALLEWMGQGMFQTSVFPIPPGAERKVVIHYEQLLRQERQLTDFLFPLSTARFTSQPLEQLSIRVAIDSESSLKSVYSPTHPVEIQRPSTNSASVSLKMINTVPASDFRLFYDSEPGPISGSVISYRPSPSEDGYFLFLASPEIKPTNAERPRKIVMLVVDKSGSMSGQKIQQAKGALQFVLNNLREGDLFNIVAYETRIESFRPELQLYNETTRAEALAYIESIYAGGGTNIYGALRTTFSFLQDASTPTYVLFTTDGLPTSGETNESKIGLLARESNRVRARVIPFGVGYDVNSRLLDRLAREHHGSSVYVRPEENIEESVGSVFSKISSPVFSHGVLAIEVDAVGGNLTANRVYPSGEIDIFEGEQVVVVGRYSKPGKGKLTLSGLINQEKKAFEFPIELAAKSDNESYSFVERLWATRRIGELIDELDLNGKNQELITELVMLSTKHGILTPYTSFLADESVRPELASTANTASASRQLDQLSEISGAGGVAQRATKQMFKAAGQTYSQSAFDGLESEAKSGGIGGKSIVTTNSQTLYRRGRILVTPETASLDIEKDRGQITKIQRFSTEYFDLVSKNSAADNQLLGQQTTEDSLLVKIRGVVYLIE
jgi:Ca-activated chloride channel family protein